MVLVAVGVGRFVNPLMLAYLFTFGGVVLGVVEGGEPLPVEEVEEPGASGEAGPRGTKDEAEGPAKRADSRTLEYPLGRSSQNYPYSIT